MKTHPRIHFVARLALACLVLVPWVAGAQSTNSAVVSYDLTTKLVRMPATFWRSNLVDGAEITFSITGGRVTPVLSAAIARDSEVTAAIGALSTVYQGLNTHLTDLSDGTLTGSKIGSGIDDDNVSFDDADSLWTATTLGGALEEMNDSINAGAPNGTGAKVHWSQLLGVPAGFADGTDDGAGGGSGNADTNAPNAWSQLQTFNGGIDASGGTNLLGVIHVTGIESDTPLSQSIGATGGTNAESARVALGLQPDVDVQTYRLALKQLALAILASGDMPYLNASGVVTNTPSTSFGRGLLNGADAAAVRALIGAVYGAGDTMTGPLLVPYIASVSSHTNVGTNQVATLRALAEVEARVSVGGFISSVDPDFEVDAGVLSLTNTTGTGPILRQSAAGTNAQLSGLTDVTVSAPLPGQSLIVSSEDTNKWVNGYPSKLQEADYWQEQFTPITGGASGISGALMPFGNSSISSGAAPTMNATYAGRYGVVLLGSATSTNWYTGGAIGFFGGGSGFDSTYIMQLRSDAILVLTNDLYARVGYTDQMSNNGPGDAVNFLVTNGVIRGEAIQGGTANITQTATGFTASSNVWYTFKVFKTNTTAHFRLYTNRTQLAWEDSVTSNVPTNSQLLMPLIMGMAGGNGATNKILMGVDNFGYRQTVQ